MPRKRKNKKAQTQYWIGYCRKSTDAEDKQIHSLNDQKQMIEDYYKALPDAEKEGRPLLLKSEAKSAYHVGRPVFNEIMAMANAGQVLGIIVVLPNRLSRNHQDTGSFIQKLVDGQISFLETTVSKKRYTAADSNDIFMLTLEGAMSWKDSRDKGDRVREAMIQRFKQDARPMGPVRMGYKKSFKPDGTKTVEVVPEVASSVLRLFQMADTGTYSYHQLALQARKMGLKGRKGGKIHASTIEKMIKDPIYKGHVRFNNCVLPGHHTPIVDEALWEHVQLVMSLRSNASSKPKKPDLRELFVFGGLLQCPLCSRTLCPYRVKGKYIYYDCKNPNTKCGIRLPQKTLAVQLQPLLESIHLQENDMADLREKLHREHKKRSAGEVQERKQLNNQYEKLQKDIVNVFGQLKDADALGVRVEVESHLKLLTQQRDSLQARLNASHIDSNEWINKAIGCFELFALLQEAIIYGSGRTRHICMNAIASNYSVKGETLVCELKSPLLQSTRKDSCSTW